MYQIKSRFSGKILFEMECTSFKVCVEAAISAGADLTEADLTRANLFGANLFGANLTRADLTEADLTRADLTRADLTEADLTRANLTGANLTRANLLGANLTEANLFGANLFGANLTEANLFGANLLGANGKKTTIEKPPIQISGLRWHIIIFDKDMRIGCEYHSLADWWLYDDARIKKMDCTALEFCNQYKTMLQGICAATGRADS